MKDFNYILNKVTKRLVKIKYVDDNLKYEIDTRLKDEYTFEPINLNKETLDESVSQSQQSRFNSGPSGKQQLVQNGKKSRNRRPSIQSKLYRRAEIETNIHDKYYRGNNYSLPFIDNTLYNHIMGTNPKSIPQLPERPSMEDVEASDRSAIARYLNDCNRIPKSAIPAIVSAGISSLHALGIYDDDISYKPLEVKEAIKRSTGNNSSSGWPLFKRKNSSSASADTNIWLKRILDKPSLYTMFKNPLMQNPQYLAHRFQPMLDDMLEKLSYKIRQVWIVPQRIISLEYYFFGEMLDRYHTQNKNSNEPLTNSGLNLAEVSMRIIRKLRGYLNPYSDKCLYSIDYSKFDSTVPGFAIDLFYLLIEERLQLGPNEAKLYNLLRYYSKRSPVVFNMCLYVFERGVSSGSLNTHIIDSWWNLTTWYLSQDFISRNSDKEIEVMLKQAEYNGIFNSYFYRKNYVPRLYPKRNDIAICGDDTLVYTRLLEIHIHERVCDFFGMKCNIDLKCCDPQANTFFIGKYWNSSCEPIQSERYITSHIIVRQKWYKPEELDFNIKLHLDVRRILSIACQFANGLQYLKKTFWTFDKFKRFLKERKGYTPLREGRENNFIEFDHIFLWQYN